MSFFPMIGLQDFPNRIKEVTGNPLVELGGGRRGTATGNFAEGGFFSRGKKRVVGISPGTILTLCQR